MISYCSLRLLAQGNEEISKLRKQKDKALRQEKRNIKDLKRVQDQIEQEREKVQNIQHQLQQMTNEKDHLLTRYISDTIHYKIQV